MRRINNSVAALVEVPVFQGIFRIRIFFGWSLRRSFRISYRHRSLFFPRIHLSISECCVDEFGGGLWTVFGLYCRNDWWDSRGHGLLSIGNLWRLHRIVRRLSYTNLYRESQQNLVRYDSWISARNLACLPSFAIEQGKRMAFLVDSNGNLHEVLW